MSRSAGQAELLFVGACCFCCGMLLLFLLLLLRHAVAAPAAAAAAAGGSPPASSSAAHVASVHFPNKNPIFSLFSFPIMHIAEGLLLLLSFRRKSSLIKKVGADTLMYKPYFWSYILTGDQLGCAIRLGQCNSPPRVFRTAYTKSTLIGNGDFWSCQKGCTPKCRHNICNF